MSPCQPHVLGLDLPVWLAALADDLGLPRALVVEAARGLAEVDGRIALHRAGALRSSRSTALLEALGVPDPVDRHVALGLALLDPHPAVEEIAAPLMTVARALSLGHLLRSDRARAPLSVAIARVERALPPDDAVRTRWAGAPDAKRRWAVLERHVARCIGRLEPALEEALVEIAGKAPILADTLRTTWAAAVTRAMIRQVAGRPDTQGPSELDRDRAAAVDWLLAHEGWPGSADHQLWGVEHVAAELDGRWFPRALIELALVEMGHDRAGAVGTILGALPVDGPRYYAGWRHIPVDGDCLGVALRLAAVIPDTGSVAAERWLTRLPADASTPVWLFGDDPIERTLRWPGDDCLASRLSLAAGLARWDRDRFAAQIDGVLLDARRQIGGGRVRGAVYYPDAFTTGQFLRLTPADDPAYRALARRLAAEQGADGGFGSPLETAWIGAPLALRGALSCHGLWRMARFLGETQWGDGSWPAEPVYSTPGKPGLMRPLQGRALSTAFCALALSTVEASLKG